MIVTLQAQRESAMGILVAAFATISHPARAQFPPDSFTNLQVLPRDIETRALIDVMRGFAIGLGVRCEFCHVGEPEAPLATFDFATDDKLTKRKAREMIRMVRVINKELLGALPERSEPPVEVGCETCHHGLSKPATTLTVLVEAYDAGGIDTAIARYRELRDRYYGSYAFDFREWQLTDFARRLARRDHVQDGITVLELNLAFFPESAQTYFMLGELHGMRGDTTAAIGNYERSLELFPANPVAEQRLKELRGTP